MPPKTEHWLSLISKQERARDRLAMRERDLRGELEALRKSEFEEIRTSLMQNPEDSSHVSAETSKQKQKLEAELAEIEVQKRAIAENLRELQQSHDEADFKSLERRWGKVNQTVFTQLKRVDEARKSVDFEERTLNSLKAERADVRRKLDEYRHGSKKLRRFIEADEKRAAENVEASWQRQMDTFFQGLDDRVYGAIEEAEPRSEHRRIPVEAALRHRKNAIEDEWRWPERRPERPPSRPDPYEALSFDGLVNITVGDAKALRNSETTGEQRAKIIQRYSR